MTVNDSSNHRAGDRLVQMIWQMALASSGQLPMPTIERVNAIKVLVASWLCEDADGEPHAE